jgi:dTDP-4-dehydrorhamnose reductase
MLTVFITGGSGYVGRNLIRRISPFAKLYTTFHTHVVEEGQSVESVKLDITNSEEVQKVITHISPDIIIHAAAIANLKLCREDQKNSFEVNVKGTYNVAQAAEKTGARMIYISSDLVFDGSKGYYKEEDIPEPICFYGKTKYEGEKIVASGNTNYCIARSALIYGYGVGLFHPFSEVVIDKLSHGRSVELYKDEYRSPIYIKNFCDIIFEISLNNRIHGLYNICGTQRLSRFDFGLKIAELFGFNKRLLIPVLIGNSTLNEVRPKDCSMYNSKLNAAIKTGIQTIEEGLSDMLQNSLYVRTT